MNSAKGITPEASNEPSVQLRLGCRILDQADIDFTLALSPDGRYASFTDVRRVGIGDLGVWDLNTHQRRVLTHNSGWTFDAVFSPDGKSIVYSYIAGRV